MNYPVIDLHCDLLTYLQMGSTRSPYDPISRVSYPQLSAGNVQLQTLAIYTQQGPDSLKTARDQIDIFKQLPQLFPEQFSCFSTPKPSTVQIIPAIENSSGFASESEPIAACLERLNYIYQELKQIFYISLTWDGENRFGGGVGATVGLKTDGKLVLDWMHDKHIAIDFSHTSDRLAEDILNYLEQANLRIPIMASHSNFRKISPYPRNLPDWLAEVIIRRKGLIGLNLFAPFILKDDPNGLFAQIEYALSLNAHDSLSFGADFFCDADIPSLKVKYQTDMFFFPEYPNASIYPTILSSLAKKLSLSTQLLKKISSENALRFLQTLSTPV